jgi:putative ATP-grasp target RiPP
MKRQPAALVHEDPLVPTGGRFPLSRAELPVNDEPPSGPATRPFGLRFASEPGRAVAAPLPPHRYCPARQVMVTEADRPVLDFTPTTVANKDGKGGPQEDWKPDLPFHDEP